MRVEHEDNPSARRMVRFQLETRGISDSSVLDAMRRVPRHLFVPPGCRQDAYGDFPVSIGHGQTVSQPYMVAFMTQTLSLLGNERVLEIGTGSGYQTAILAETCGELYTVERIGALADAARARLRAMGYADIHFRTGDGSDGWPEHAPFDRILVTAAAPQVPRTLQEQLADNGMLLVPVGDRAFAQVIVIVRRIGGHFETLESIGCRFVPLIGKSGYEE